jgi:hypothetical protein
VLVKASDVTGPTPGIVIKHRHGLSSRTRDSTCRCRRENSSRSFPLAASRGANDLHQIGHIFDELKNTGLEASRANDANLETEVSQQPTDIVLDGDGLLLQKLARRQQSAMLLALQRLDMHRPEQIDPHHLSDAPCIVAIVLFTCAFKNAFACRVSMQIAGNPASTNR